MRILHALVAVGLAASTISSSLADPAAAEDVAYQMAKKYVDKGFAMAPTDNSGLLGAGGSVKFLIPVNKGLDYVFLVGSDAAARDVDIYVYDEVGSLILDDRRTGKLAGVQFRSSYNGTTIVYLHMAGADGLAAWYVLVGRRGIAKSGISTPSDAATPAAPAGNGP